MGKKDVQTHKFKGKRRKKFQFPIWVRKKLEREASRMIFIRFQFPIWVRKIMVMKSCINKFQFPIWVRKEFEIKEKKRLTKILFQFPIWVRKFSRKKQIERLLPYQLFQFPIWVRKNNNLLTLFIISTIPCVVKSPKLNSSANYVCVKMM